MSQEVDTTPVGEVIQPEATAQTEQAPESKPVETIGETLGEKKVVDSVPLARLNKEITRRKELEAKIEQLQKAAAADTMSKTEIAHDLKALAEEHNIDAGFLDKLAKTIKAQADADIDERLRPIAEREQMEKREKAFTEHFTKALENMPDFKGVVNPEVIKQLAFNPANANKTFAQLIEETYGNTLQGKRTIETATPRGGAKNEAVDIDRARRDSTYFKEVMANPELKKEYNDRLHERVQI
jgi:hypothetical protein